MSDRKPYHHGDLRAALLKASLELIREKGAREFTLREAARRAGVSHTAPYRHFHDKAELLAAIAEDGFNRLLGAMRVAADKSIEPFHRLQSAGIGYIDFAQDHPEHFSIMFSAELKFSAHPSLKTAADRCFSELVTLIAACSPAPSIPVRSPEIEAIIAWTQVHGIAELALRRQLRFRNRKELREFARLAIEVFANGLVLKTSSKSSELKRR